MFTSLPFLSLGSTVAVSVISLVGVLFFALQHTLLKRILFFLLSFSVGALLGDVFLHMIPEILEADAVLLSPWVIMLGGILASFILEKFIHWRHCHDEDCTGHTRPVGIMNLVGDFIHNALDGILIAGSYAVSIPLGLSTTIAVLLHEIPQEMGDMGVLLYSGFSRSKAVLFNFLTALAAVLGALGVIAFGTFFPTLGEYLVPFAAGNFLYIAGSDLIPELHRENGTKHSALQLLGILLGIGLMAMLTVLE